MNTHDLFRARVPLIETLERLNIVYHIGGSVASSIYGEPRATQDADIIADIQTIHVASLVKTLETDYYIDADMIRDAIRRRSSFNIIYYSRFAHFLGGLKELAARNARFDHKIYKYTTL